MKKKFHHKIWILPFPNSNAELPIATFKVPHNNLSSSKKKNNIIFNT
ncbi:hypothetical protein QVZ41_09485 [Wenyingzhuangia sp. chi5]|uniref:Uncharacterized protein n=1 Tax=Wenyingzhuangia gilva TaxID=3057677 RepID=A0ABT8VSX2_9FLAO|nr:hypothetical protein [Wenyingzhuangia sp. chi5]MDO3695074.1 hypothetical protein [Wenyingzhuangia sp. chi5]